jgi:uncharacterized protein YecE (DUF72 family)
MTAEIRLGTSSFTATGWAGAFYPRAMKPSDCLAYYSTRFDTVEVDSTFYRCPTIEAVNNWALKTPPGFIFSLKVLQTITHQKVLVDCEKEFEEFVSTAGILGDKLGPMGFQFPYFNKDVFNTPVQFLDRLKPFFKRLPRRGGHKFAVEIRNKWWLTKRFADLLKENNVALVLQDHSLMPSAERVFSTIDPLTADFVYIRLLGDRKAIEAKTTVWSRSQLAELIQQFQIVSNMAAPSLNRTDDRTEVVVKHARTQIDVSLAEWETKSGLHQQKRKQGC